MVTLTYGGPINQSQDQVVRDRPTDIAALIESTSTNWYYSMMLEEGDLVRLKGSDKVGIVLHVYTWVIEGEDVLAKVIIKTANERVYLDIHHVEKL